MALVPFNLLNSALEQLRHDLEDAASRIELLLLKTRPPRGEAPPLPR